MLTFNGCLNKTAPLVVVRWFEVTHMLYPALRILLLCSSGMSPAFSRDFRSVAHVMAHTM